MVEKEDKMCARSATKPAATTLSHIAYIVYTSPLVYQSTTSLGLGQVQMPRPKEVVATGAAARGSKK